MNFQELHSDNFQTTLIQIQSSLQMIQVPTGLGGVLFWSALILLFFTLLMIVIRKWSGSEEFLQHIREITHPQKRHAQLNRVVCYHCERGSGIYNPVYRVVDGIPHVEGACSNCGKHISVRLKG